MIRQLASSIARPVRWLIRAFVYIDSAYLHGHPELAFFPTEADRKAAERTAARRTLRGWRFWVGVFVAIVAAIITAPWITWLLGHIGIALPGRWNIFLPVIPLVVIGVLAANWWLRRDVPRSLRRSLLECGVPICRPCGYLLMGVPLFSGRCPECGRRFDPRVRELLGASEDVPSQNSPASAGTRNDTSPVLDRPGGDG